jgi:hypothetical protein
MKKAALFLSLAALAAAVAPAAARPSLSPEAELAKLLEGRVAGAPVDCINPHFNTNTRIIDKTAIVYGSGRTIYVQRPVNARALDSNDMLVTNLTGSGQLCRIDTVHLHDRTGGWYRGFVGLNQFVPYTRPRVAAR